MKNPSGNIKSGQISLQMGSVKLRQYSRLARKLLCKRFALLREMNLLMRCLPTIGNPYITYDISDLKINGVPGSRQGELASAANIQLGHVSYSFHGNYLNI